MFVRHCYLIAIFYFLFPVVVVRGTGPQWWTDEGLTVPGATLADYAAANGGQLKNMARGARDHFEVSVRGGAGSVINTMVDDWINTTTPQTDDYAVINLGQLKAVAQPFYDRLIQFGLASAYPWSGTVSDYAVANLGQLKNVFSFDLVDSDGDGIPDVYEQRIIAHNATDGLINISDVDPYADYDGGGVPNLQEYLYGMDPTDLNDDTAGSANFFPDALARIEQHRKDDIDIVVRDSAGNPISGAQITVEMTAHAFRWGTAVSASRINDSSPDGVIFRQKLLENFNGAVLENVHKWPAWDGLWGAAFGQAQATSAMNWLAANNLSIRGHVASWGTMSGAEADGGGATSTIPTELFNHIADKIPAIGSQVTEWDALNHPVGWGPTTYGDLFGNSFYHDILTHTRAVAPAGVELWANEAGALYPGSVADKYDLLLSYLKAQGSPLDGVGFQGHFRNIWWNINQYTHLNMYDQLDRFAQIYPRLQVTEFDVDVATYDTSGNVVSYDQAFHAKLVNDYLITMFSHPELEGITMWGFWESAHWIPTAALYNQDWTERPALQAYRDLVFDAWWTDEQGISANNGTYSLRGFKGDYTITVTHNGQSSSLPYTTGSGQLVVVMP